MLLCPPGLDFVAAFFGCLYAGIIAVPGSLPDEGRPERDLARLLAVSHDAQPSAWLGTASVIARLRESRLGRELPASHWISTDDGNDEPGAAKLGASTKGDDVAFLQYTSGSTAAPKGVMVTHANLLHNSAAIYRLADHGSASVTVSWLPTHHDMGLIGGIIQPVFGGFLGVLMSPLAFLRRPIRWLEAISRYRATSSPFPNFALDLCVQRVTAAERAPLDLSSWRVACNGAEPLRAESLRRFSEMFGPVGFRSDSHCPAYGLAEATLLVSGGRERGGPRTLVVGRAALREGRVEVRADAAEGWELVGCGQALADQRVVIAHPESCVPCGPDQIGEIWVQGPSVARGYWNREEETTRTFRATLDGTSDGPFLRTGDLGFLHDGQLYVTGRAKDVVIVDGVKHHPVDIERTAEAAAGAASRSVRRGGCAAFGVDRDGRDELIVMIEVSGTTELDSSPIFSAIRSAVATNHGIATGSILLLQAGALARTPNGKLQRGACRDLFLRGALAPLARDERVRPTHAQPPARSASSEPTHTRAVIEDWLLRGLARRTDRALAHFDPDAAFTDSGLASREVVEFSVELEQWIGRAISPLLFYQHPTVRSLAAALAEADGAERAPPIGAASAEPIAIVGLACRFPGAPDEGSFWQLLSGGIDAVDDPGPARRDESSARVGRAGFLERIDTFDADFFRISPREAVHVDPQQRLILELAWEALEDAGYTPEALAGSATAVVVGISNNDYQRLASPPSAGDGMYAATGGTSSVAANRVSYFLDLRGPSVAVDSACSSSLVALHVACESLRHGEADLALVGGVNLMVDPSVDRAFTDAGFLSPDHRCKTFDARADGYVRGEGGGVVVLERLSRALSRGDRIRAVIRGSAVNQDGRTNGLTAPNPEAQKAVLRRAYENAGRSPADVTFVEAHGTGTPLGDPIEATALGAVLGAGRSRENALLVGSVKTNIGHLEAAAGMAGLIKTVLCLEKGLVVPHLHFERQNPLIPLEELGLRIPTATSPLPGPRPALAGVSSFGFGGTNAHVVVEEYPASAAASGARDLPEHAELFTLSSHSEAALVESAGRHRDWLQMNGDAKLARVCGTRAARRSHLRERLAVVASSGPGLARSLDAFIRGEHVPEVVRDRARGRTPLCFVFPGQGSQWAGMGLDLVEREPVFRAALERCEQAITAQGGGSIIAALHTESAAFRGLDVDAVQPWLFSLQVSLAALWRSWGVVPAVVVGHSMGEIAAAHVAGALSLEDAAKIVCRRSRLLRKTSGRGAMALLELSWKDAEAAIERYEGLCLAAGNGPTATVVAGMEHAVRAVVTDVTARGAFARQIDVTVASHSPQMDPIRAELLGELDTLSPRATGIAFRSTVTTQLTEGSALTADYWARNLRDPVRFWDTVARMMTEDAYAFLELSPHPSLSPMIAASTPDDGPPPVAVASLRRDEDGRVTMLSALASLYGAGVDIDFSWMATERPASLPAYPWQRKRLWHEGLARASAPDPEGARVWESRMTAAARPNGELQRVGDKVVLSTHAQIAMMWQAASAEGHPVELHEIEILAPCELSPRGETLLRAYSLSSEGRPAIRLYNKSPDGEWALCARCLVVEAR
jgi:myxalamid-type polyketide synthase MxaE and MxaD